MTHRELHELLAEKTGEDIETIERLGFELIVPDCNADRKELKRQRRLRLWRQARRERRLVDIAGKIVKS